DFDRLTTQAKEKAGEVAAKAKEEAAKFGEKAKESSVGKAILGEDGKFDKEDADRLANQAKEAGKGLIEKVKSLFEEKK
ncbi:MAG: hypothetical protein II004_03720, partial [Erysipelotrichaceae bacterium]|nr:hypothetical protein [Erysipelotrichaceae bacterium]